MIDKEERFFSVPRLTHVRKFEFSDNKFVDTSCRSGMNYIFCNSRKNILIQEFCNMKTW
jgi:alpha-D-ribose 1-methylphosphonate 5-phosphate C-P lyase